MSDLNPAEVFRRYRRGELGAAAAVDYLKTIIESGSTAEWLVKMADLRRKATSYNIILRFFFIPNNQAYGNPCNDYNLHILEHYQDF